MWEKTENKLHKPIYSIKIMQCMQILDRFVFQLEEAAKSRKQRVNEEFEMKLREREENKVQSITREELSTA